MTFGSPVNHQAQPPTPSELKSNSSAEQLTANRAIFATPYHLNSQTITATSLFSNGTPIQDTTHSIVSCISNF